MEISSNFKPKSVQLEAVIIRADGTRVDLGTINFWHKNPLIRLAWAIRFIWQAKKRAKKSQGR